MPLTFPVEIIDEVDAMMIACVATDVLGELTKTLARGEISQTHHIPAALYQGILLMFDALMVPVEDKLAELPVTEGLAELRQSIAATKLLAAQIRHRYGFPQR